MKIKLKKAVMHKGQELEVLDIPLEELTGNDLIEIEKQLTQSGEVPFVTDFNKTYLISVAAKAAHVPVETLKFTSAKDFTKIVNEVRIFLMDLVSEEEQTAEIPETLPATSSEESR